MEESQREAMYNAWARGKKWMRVEVEPFEDGWKAYCAEGKFGCIIRPTRILAIQRIQGMLVDRGYEISNMPELMGIPAPEKRRTFLEWCKEINSRQQKKEPSLSEYKRNLMKEMIDKNNRT